MIDIFTDQLRVQENLKSMQKYKTGDIILRYLQDGFLVLLFLHKL